MNFPRQLEADGSVEKIREALASHTVRLWPEGRLDVPLLHLSDPLVNALQKARLQRRIRPGFEDIAEKMAAEQKGIEFAHKQMNTRQNERVSRLLLFSNDGAERLYRHIEQILTGHSLRILGCQLDCDSKTMGQLIARKSTGIKVILVEHKDAVSDVLRALLQKQ